MDGPWTQLPPRFALELRKERASLAAEIISEIRRQVPEFARPLAGSFGAGIQQGVESALEEFADLVERGRPGGDGVLSGERLRVHRALGRGELSEGRSLDALQAAYRLGARVAWRRYARVARRAGLGADRMVVLAEAIFAHIDELVSAAVLGYAEAKADEAGTLGRRRLQLLELLLSGAPAAAVRRAAAAADWPLPAEVACVALGRPADPRPAGSARRTPGRNSARSEGGHATPDVVRNPVQAEGGYADPDGNSIQGASGYADLGRNSVQGASGYADRGRNSVQAAGYADSAGNSVQAAGGCADQESERSTGRGEPGDLAPDPDRGPASDPGRTAEAGPDRRRGRGSGPAPDAAPGRGTGESGECRESGDSGGNRAGSGGSRAGGGAAVPRGARPRMPDLVLADLDGEEPYLLVPEPGLFLRDGQVQQVMHGRGAVIGPTVPPAHAADSLRWARELRACLPEDYRGGPVDCDRCLPELLLLGDPVLVRLIADRRLGPLAALTPKRGERLAATLLAWLQTNRGSAPDVAARLGIHPQTARQRLHQVQELFGAALGDADARFELEVALRSRLMAGALAPPAAP